MMLSLASRRDQGGQLLFLRLQPCGEHWKLVRLTQAAHSFLSVFGRVTLALPTRVTYCVTLFCEGRKCPK